MRKTTRLLILTIVFAVLTVVIGVISTLLVVDEGLGWERLLQLAIFIMGVNTTVQFAKRWLSARRTDRESVSGATD